MLRCKTHGRDIRQRQNIRQNGATARLWLQADKAGAEIMESSVKSAKYPEFADMRVHYEKMGNAAILCLLSRGDEMFWSALFRSDGGRVSLPRSDAVGISRRDVLDVN